MTKEQLKLLLDINLNQPIQSNYENLTYLLDNQLVKRNNGFELTDKGNQLLNTFISVSKATLNEFEPLDQCGKSQYYKGQS